MKMQVSLFLKAVFLTGILGWACLSRAQEPLSLTLTKAVDLAIKQRPDLESGDLDYHLAAAANEKIRAARLPQIRANGDFRVNTQLQSTVLPFDITGQDPEGTSTVKFGTRFSNTLGLQVDQLIYDPTNKLKWAINENRLADQVLAQQQDTLSVRQEVLQAYYSAVYYAEKMKLDSQALSRAQFNLQVGQNQWEAGTILENDKKRLEVSEANSRLGLQQSQKDYDMAVLRLKQVMHMETSTPVRISETLEDLVKPNSGQPAFEVTLRPEVKRSILNEHWESLQQQEVMADNKPTISAYGHYGLLQLNDRFNPLKWKTWYPYNYLGVQVSIPIFDGKQARLAAQDHQWALEKWKLNTVKVKYDYQQQYAHEILAMNQAKAALDEAKANRSLANELYQTDQFRFEQGVLLPTALRESEYQLQVAQDQYLDAWYAVLLADLNLRMLLAYQPGNN
ncbi:MAG: TolC family protein [Saprospiraceae bacterium]|nr:TolC family protein [Saprospiraceae bacterium]